MESLKNISINGLKELRENGLKRLKINSIKNLRGRQEESRIECISDAELEDLAKKREEIKREIKKLNQERKGIETRICLIFKEEKGKCEEITEYPWREEIFPPLPEKTYVRISQALEVKDSFSGGEKTEFSEVKDSSIKIKDKKADRESEESKSGKSKSEEEISEDMASTPIQTMVENNAERADSVNETGKKDGEKAILEIEEKIKVVYPFSAEKLSENKIPEKSSSNNSIEKSKTESKSNPAASLFGENLIEELLSSDDLSPEEEQGFMKYLQEPEIGEIINDLKDVRSLLSREKHAG